MKKYLGLFVLLAIALLVGTNVVSAETNSTGKNAGWNLKENVKREVKKPDIKDGREAFRAEMKTKREDFVSKLKTEREAFKTDLEARKEEWKKLNADRKRDFCGKAKEMTTRKFEVAITQLEKFQTRLGEIISKLKTDGKDTTLAQEALDLSKSKLADAKTKLAEIKALMPEGGCENMTAETFEKIKLGAREAKDLLKESQENLRQALKEIKNLKDKDRDENDREEKEVEDDKQ